MQPSKYPDVRSVPAPVDLWQRVLDLEAQLLTQSRELRRIARAVERPEHGFTVPHVTERWPV